MAAALTWVLAGVGSFILLKIVDVIVGLRVKEDDEYQGLDLSQHGESGYNLEDVSVFGAEVAEDVSARSSEAATNVARI